MGGIGRERTVPQQLLAPALDQNPDFRRHRVLRIGPDEPLVDRREPLNEGGLQSGVATERRHRVRVGRRSRNGRPGSPAVAGWRAFRPRR